MSKEKQIIEELIAPAEVATTGFLKSLLDSAFYGIMAFRAVRNNKGAIVDFEWLFINDVAGRVVGRKAETLIGKCLLEEMPGNKELGLFDVYSTVVETGVDASVEQFYQSDGLEKWFKISATKLGDGLTITLQDISDYKEAILDAKTRELKYRRLFEESIDSIFVSDEKLLIKEVNPSFGTLFGFEQSEMLAKPVSKLFKDEQVFKEIESSLNEKGRINAQEVVLLDAAKRKKNCLLNAVSFTDATTGEKQVLGVIFDMTTRKRAERELVVAEKLSMTGKIARTIAHEVRNPLTNLSLALDQLKDEVPDEIEDAALYFEIIERNATRIGALISDLLSSSKPRDLKLVPLSLNEAVKSSLKLVDDRLKLKDISLVEDYSTDLPNLSIDQEQLSMALLNLYVNAIEAMKIGEGELLISTYREEDRIVLSISDNGEGIPDKHLPQLFEPFFSAKKEGTGLGLTAVQNIIRSHNASIIVESEVGVGTAFYIRFKNGDSPEG